MSATVDVLICCDHVGCRASYHGGHHPIADTRRMAAQHGWAWRQWWIDDLTDVADYCPTHAGTTTPLPPPQATDVHYERGRPVVRLTTRTRSGARWVYAPPPPKTGGEPQPPPPSPADRPDSNWRG